MANRCVKSERKHVNHEICSNASIERIKKIRALNCNPADVGFDGYVWKKFFINSRPGGVCRFL